MPVLAYRSSFGCNRLQIITLAFGGGAFGGSLVPVLLRVNAKFPPRRLRKIDVIVLCCLLDGREGQCTIGIGDADDLIEPCDCVAYVLRIRQRLFSLVRKCINRVW
jgi:hypothetical protein